MLPNAKSRLIKTMLLLAFQTIEPPTTSCPLSKTLNICLQCDKLLPPLNLKANTGSFHLLHSSTLSTHH